MFEGYEVNDNFQTARAAIAFLQEVFLGLRDDFQVTSDNGSFGFGMATILSSIQHDIIRGIGETQDDVDRLLKEKTPEKNPPDRVNLKLVSGAN